MAILGYNVKDTADASTFAAGRMYASVFTLGAASVLNELHGWFGGTGTPDTNNVRLVIYADDGAGSPGARVAYTNPLSITGSDVELSQSGFSDSLPAGDYWIGFKSTNTNGFMYAGTGTHKGITSGVTDPPPDPFGTTNTSGTRKHSVWAVISAAGVDAPFIASTTVVNTPTVTHQQVDAPFVASTTTVNTATLVHQGQVDAPFIAATGTVYTATLTGTGTATTLAAPFVAATTVVYTADVSRFTAPFITATTTFYVPSIRRVGVGAQPVGVNVGFNDHVTENAPTWNRLDA